MAVKHNCPADKPQIKKKEKNYEKTSLNTNYIYTPTGYGVNAYVIDSGVNNNHPESGGRVAPGKDFITPGGNGEDCVGHGTYVAVRRFMQKRRAKLR